MLFVLSRVRGKGDLALSRIIRIDWSKRGGDGMQFVEEDNFHRGHMGFEDVENMDGQFHVLQHVFAYVY
jgi:hypothetical protein